MCSHFEHSFVAGDFYEPSSYKADSCDSAYELCQQSSQKNKVCDFMTLDADFIKTAPCSTEMKPQLHTGLFKLS